MQMNLFKFSLILIILFELAICINAYYGHLKNNHHSNNSSHNRKKSLHNRGSKSNKTNKRQDKSLTTSTIKPFNPDEPDFDILLTSTTVISTSDSTEANNQDSSAKYQTPNVISSNVTTVLGQNAMLSCVVRNLGSYNILWLRVNDGDVLAFDNMLITQDPRFKLAKKTTNESNLFIQGVRLSDAGEYACQINTQNVKSKFYNLIVLTPPAFSEIELNHHIPNHYYGHLALASQMANSGSKGHNQHGQQTSTTSINVVEGKQLVLECNAFGLPKPTINWHVKRFKSENVTVYSLNSNKIVVNNVMRKQYEFFECEANNKVPPSTSKKFKINVLYRPDITITPNRVYIMKTPTQVKFNCTVNSYPESNIVWMKNYKDLKAINKTSKKLRQALANEPVVRHHKKVKKHNRTKAASKWSNRNTRDELSDNPNTYLLNSVVKYSISDHVLNDTFKYSSLVLNVENEDDFGVYECFSNNTAGSKSVKFHVYGDQYKANNPGNINYEIETTVPPESKISEPVDYIDQILDKKENQNSENNEDDPIDETKSNNIELTTINNLVDPQDASNKHSSLFESIFGSSPSSSSSSSNSSSSLSSFYLFNSFLFNLIAIFFYLKNLNM